MDDEGKFEKGGSLTRNLDKVFDNAFEEGGETKEDLVKKFLTDKIKNLETQFEQKKSVSDNLQKGLMLREIRKYREMLNKHDSKKTKGSDALLEFFEGTKVRFGNMDAKRTLTKNSALTKSESKLVRSESFLRWFGDWEEAKATGNYTNVSKVIDSSTKEPMVVYHGTDTLFTNWETYTTNNLHYFAQKRDFAEFFATSWDERGDKAGLDSAVLKKKNPFRGKYIYNCFLDIKNPIDFSVFGVQKKPIKTFLDFLKIKYNITNFNWIQSARMNSGNTDFQTKVYAWMIIRMFQSFNIYIKENTPFDGFIFYEFFPEGKRKGLEDASLCFTTFESYQVKFANANSFSEQKDSRFKIGGFV